MDRSAYQQMAADEATHWWFAGRRRIVARLIETLVRPPAEAEILEAGCGTGGNLELLSTYGRLRAFEFDDMARRTAAEKTGMSIAYGALPDDLPYADASFDMIALLDVLEHIDDDKASLAALGRKLKPHGSILLTVPAMPWLWSRHDEIHHHKRRYTRSSLTEAIRAAGLEPKRIGYFNTLLFPLAVAHRLAEPLRRQTGGTAAPPGPVINALFTRIFAAERHVVGTVPLLFGLSLFAVVGQRRR
jgi:SAM-dependent methyltransferase